MQRCTLDRSTHNELAMNRFVWHEAGLVQSVADTMVTLIREQTSDPDVIEAAQELAGIFVIETTLDGSVPFASDLRLYGLKGAAQSALTFQVAALRPQMKEHILGGQALLDCKCDPAELAQGLDGWRGLTRIVDSWNLNPDAWAER